MNRPKGIVLTTILMALCNSRGWFIIDYTAPHARGTFIIFTLMILLGYLVLWGYWRGRNRREFSFPTMPLAPAFAVILCPASSR